MQVDVLTIYSKVLDILVGRRYKHILLLNAYCRDLQSYGAKSESTFSAVLAF